MRRTTINLKKIAAVIFVMLGIWMGNSSGVLASDTNVIWIESPGEGYSITAAMPNSYGDGLYIVEVRKGDLEYTAHALEGGGHYYYGYVNRQGKWILDPIYISAYPFNNGYAKVWVELSEPKNGGIHYWNEAQLINKQGEKVVEIEVERSTVSGQATSLVAVRQDGKWGFADTTGRVVIPCKYGAVMDFCDGYAVVSSGDFTGCSWDTYWKIGNGVAESYNGNTFGLIDMQGNPVTEEIYTYISNVQDGTAICQRAVDKKVGILQLEKLAERNTIIPKNVQVSLPTFDVTLNGHIYNNDYSKYPFIVYKDITYFPMTYYDSRLLGLSTAWSQEKGLSISCQEGFVYEYLHEVNLEKNKEKQIATIVEGCVTVNDAVIDVSAEEYPLLLFRDVTYFPLTWRFIVDEFGWEYHFSLEKGLNISNQAAVWRNPNTWEGIVEYGAPVMGTGELLFGVGFMSENETKTLEHAILSYAQKGVMLFNFFTSRDVDILPSEKPWEYRIYRIIDGQEHLVYKQLIPFYSGLLPSRNHAYSCFDVAYWSEAYAQKGNYRITLQHPDMLSYRVDSGNIEQFTLQNGRGPGLSFESYVTIY